MLMAGGATSRRERAPTGSLVPRVVGGLLLDVEPTSQAEEVLR